MQKNTNVTKRPEGQPERVPQRPLAASPVDIFENSSELLLVTDMPGVADHQINIRVEKNQLLLEGAFEPEQNAPAALNLKPFSYVRSFLLPGGIDTEHIAAELRNGVLQVHLPKLESHKPRQISVKAG